MSLHRKKATGLLRKITSSQNLEIIVNDIPMETFLEREGLKLRKEDLDEFVKLLPIATYHLSFRGGGLGSRADLITKLIYSIIKDNLKKTNLKPTLEAKNNLVSLKNKYPLISKFDTRRSYPKRAGGPKSRTRYQKSYR